MEASSNVFVGTQVDSSDLNELLNQQDELQLKLGITLNHLELSTNILKSENEYLKTQIEEQNIERGISYTSFINKDDDFKEATILNTDGVVIFDDIGMVLPLQYTYLKIDDNQELNNLLTFVCTTGDGFMHSIYDYTSKSYKFTYYTNNEDLTALNLLATFDPYDCNLIAFNYSPHVYMSVSSNNLSANGDIRLLFDSVTETSTFITNVTFSNDVLSINNNESFGMYSHFIAFEIKDIHIAELSTDSTLNLNLMLPKYTSDTTIQTMDINESKNDYVYYDMIKYNISSSQDNLKIKNYLYSGILVNNNLINITLGSITNSERLYLNLNIIHQSKPIVLFDAKVIYTLRG